MSYEAFFPVFHQREMLDQAVAEGRPHTPSPTANAVRLSSVEMWVPVGLPHTYKAWRTWVLQWSLRHNRESVRAVKCLLKK